MRGQAMAQQQRLVRGWKGDFTVHASVYGKVQAGPMATLYAQERRKKKKRASCLARAGLSSYLYRQYVTCVPPAYARGRIHPTTRYYAEVTRGENEDMYVGIVQPFAP